MSVENVSEGVGDVNHPAAAALPVDVVTKMLAELGFTCWYGPTDNVYESPAGKVIVSEDGSVRVDPRPFNEEVHGVLVRLGFEYERIVCNDDTQPLDHYEHPELGTVQVYPNGSAYPDLNPPGKVPTQADQQQGGSSDGRAGAFSAEYLEGVRCRIADKKIATYKKHVSVLTDYMEPDKIYSLEDLEVALEINGISCLCAGPTTSYMVMSGIAERVARGSYRLIRAGRSRPKAKSETA